jgi:hypothetical protein
MKYVALELLGAAPEGDAAGRLDKVALDELDGTILELFVYEELDDDDILEELEHMDAD